jgi:glycosyltransferase involved in cell wall biosynthesis
MQNKNNSEPKKSVQMAMISSQAFSLINFRGALIEELNQRGVQVYAFASDYDEKSRLSIKAKGAIPLDYSLSRTGMNPLKDLIDLFRLSAQLRRLKIDVTFAYFIKPVIYGTLAAWVAGVPKRYVMIEGAGYVFTESGTATSWKRRMLRMIGQSLYRIGLSKAHRIFLLNPDDERLFVDEKMATRDKTVLLNGIGLDLAYFQAVPQAQQPVCFIMVARLLREKGVFDFVDAARLVKFRHPTTSFLLLGDVDLNPSSISESQVQAWVDEGVLEWPGHVTDVRPWIAKANVFVLPSYREGLPRSTQEAMAMGRPVITTDVPGCRETVQDGVNGLIVPVRDPNALANAMISFIDTPALIEKMGAESRKMAVNQYDVHQINSLILRCMDL